MELTHKKDHTHYWKLYIDGASRNNPGVAGAGIYILKDNKPVFMNGYFLGIKTNNQAEYLALLLGLYHATSLMGPEDLLMIISDSLLLVRQLQGEYAIRNDYIRIAHGVAKQLLVGVNYDIGHVLRDENKHADKLANKGIDDKIIVPEAFMNILRAHGIAL
jgi:ribonuclease HI